MNLLVFRFSAMGDVALTVPVVRNILKHNEDIHITLVTNPSFIPFFYGIDRLTILPADFKKKYHGLKGLYKLSLDIKSENKFDYLIDLHSVLRTWVLSFLLSIRGLKVYRINRKLLQGKAITH